MEKELSFVKVPIKVPTITFKIMYSEPKIFKRYKIKNGKKVACVDPGCNWYVYFYYRNPITNKMEDKYIYKNGINRFKTVASRTEEAKKLQLALKTLLNDGFCPYKVYTYSNLIPIDNKKQTVLTAFTMAFNSKVNEWGQSTINTNNAHFNVFKEWISSVHIEHLPISEFKRKHVVNFLDYIMQFRKGNATTRNNYKRTISSLLTKLIELEVLEYNPADKINLIKSSPVKNKPFSNQQLKDIKKWLINNDPYLHKYLKFVTYAFLRPTEINKIKIKDINWDRKLINVGTKTNANFIPIIDILEEVIKTMDLQNYKDDCYIFTKYLKPDYWITKYDKSKSDFFGRRFNNLKKALNYGDEYGIYSFRHNASLNLFLGYINRDNLSENEAINKLQKIMRHKNPNTTRIYLRDIGAFSVKDYSKDYTVDF